MLDKPIFREAGRSAPDRRVHRLGKITDRTSQGGRLERCGYYQDRALEPASTKHCRPTINVKLIPIHVSIGSELARCFP